MKKLLVAMLIIPMVTIMLPRKVDAQVRLGVAVPGFSLNIGNNRYSNFDRFRLRNRGVQLNFGDYNNQNAILQQQLALIKSQQLAQLQRQAQLQAARQAALLRQAQYNQNLAVQRSVQQYNNLGAVRSFNQQAFFDPRLLNLINANQFNSKFQRIGTGYNNLGLIGHSNRLRSFSSVCH